MYEHVIIGGGIAGLIVIRELLENNKKIFLLEASNNLGGKIKTILSNNGTVKYESGPWRVNKNHIRLNKLIDQFKLTRIPINLELKASKLKTFKKVPGLSILDTKLLEDSSIINAITENIKTGYFDLFDMDSSTNAYDIKAINKTDNYFLVKEGLGEIVNQLEKMIGLQNISMESMVLDVEYLADTSKYKVRYQCRQDHNTFMVKTIYSRCIFLCLPPENYVNWSIARFLKPQIYSVETRSLHHIYAKVSNKNTIKHHRKVDNALSQILYLYILIIDLSIAIIISGNLFKMFIINY